MSTIVGSNVSDGTSYVYNARLHTVSETGFSVIISVDNWKYLYGGKKFWMRINARFYSFKRQHCVCLLTFKFRITHNKMAMF